ncbi:MAG: hypothetical protein HYX27_10775 [Acidobacteria bacterium]|nr:hypothetical protein [Acidobacteriota bacterium]
MDAAPRLVEMADAFTAARLEAILIGNAGAALHGAPETTLDFDYLYRSSSANEAKLRKVAGLLGGQVTQPFPAISTVFRILRLDSQLQIDLTSQVHGVKSFNSLRSKAVQVEIDGRTILVASLADLIRMSRCFMSSRELSKNKKTRKPAQRELALEAIRQASEQELTGMIRRQLAIPMNKRTHFLRIRLPNGGSCL